MRHSQQPRPVQHGKREGKAMIHHKFIRILSVASALVLGIAILPSPACALIFVAQDGPDGTGGFDNNTHGVVSEFNNTGTPLNNSLASGLSGGYGIAVSEPYVYVTNAGTGTIGKYTTSGAVVNPALVSGLQGP